MARVKHRKERGKAYTGCWYYETQKGDRVYYCSYRKGGKNITAKCGARSKGYTLKQCALFRADAMRGIVKTRQEKRAEAREQQSRSIESLYQRYIIDNFKGADDYRFKSWVLPWWQDKDITTATNQDCANYRIWLEESGDLKPQSVKHAIALFRRVVRHAKKHIHGFEIKIDDYSVPKVNNEVTEDLTQEQYQRLLSVLQSDKVTVEGKTVKINRPVADIMLLILNTGMRRGEVLKLQWQHVNFDRGTILLKEPKGGKDVLLPMNTGAREVLMRQKKTSMYVFPNPQGGKRSHINVQARKIRDLAGLPKDFRPLHGLRHYYATELAAKGVDITVISELLGHKSVGITMRYVNARDEKKRMAVELVSVGGMK